MPTWTITDNRGTTGEVTILVEAVPADLNRQELARLATTTGAKLNNALRATATPALVTADTLRQAVRDGVITAAAARELLSLQEDAEDPAATIGRRS